MWATFFSYPIEFPRSLYMWPFGGLIFVLIHIFMMVAYIHPFIPYIHAHINAVLHRYIHKLLNIYIHTYFNIYT